MEPEPIAPFTLDQLRYLKDRMNWVSFDEFCDAVYPGMNPESNEVNEFTIEQLHKRDKLIRLYRKFQDDLIGFLSYCDTAQLIAVLGILNKELVNGDDG